MHLYHFSFEGMCRASVLGGFLNRPSWVLLRPVSSVASIYLSISASHGDPEALPRIRCVFDLHIFRPNKTAPAPCGLTVRYRV